MAMPRKPLSFPRAKWTRGTLAVIAVLAMPILALAEDRKTSEEDQINWAKERQFWSFRAPVPQARPEVKNKRWPSQRLDYFVLARMEQKSLSPSPEADKRTLIRRATFDLTGLPPTPEEGLAFLSNHRPDAYARLVDRLLASPRFGERMASVWLPLVRYAEDQAHQVGNDTTMFYPHAYRYREWVINAFNRDLPYDQFLRLQLAADRYLPKPAPDAEDDCRTTAAMPPPLPGSPGVESGDLAALGFIGLGPKYYNRGQLEVLADEWEDRVDTVGRAMLGLTVACARCHDHKFDPITMRDYYGLAGVFASTRMVNKTADGRIVDGKINADKMPPDTMHVVEEGETKDLNVFIRGNVQSKGPVAERRFLRVLSEGEPVAFKDGSGRKELAEAIASSRNPLTARVMVNRLWAVFFGQPLVPTPSNFGHSGQPPTYPELLDDLAARFPPNGWSVKGLVRQIVLSSAYRQSSRDYAEQARLDAANELFWRMNRRRLSVEQWRDTVLFVSGDMEWAGGESLELDDPKNVRRTVYARVSRLKLNDLLMHFDYPDANVHAEKRAVTTTPMQKLFMLNSSFMLGRAGSLAARLTMDPKESDKSRIERAYRLLFGREPEKAELKLALEFLRQPGPRTMTRWEQYAQVLLTSNEMLYVD